MTKLPMVQLDRLDNYLTIRCPNLAFLTDVKEFLTFKRSVRQQNRGKVWFQTVREPYFLPTDDPYVLTCPAGFTQAITEQFRDDYEFGVTTRRAKRIRQNLEVDWSRIGPEVRFRPSQREIIQKIVSASRGRIVVPTAVGKSFIITQLVKLHPKARIIVSTFSQSVLDQIYETMMEEPLLRRDVGIRRTAKNKNTDGRIVCVSLGTLQNYLPIANGTQQNVDLLLVDEYHECGSPDRLDMLYTVKQAKMIGFSANNKRPDGAEFVLNGLFGPELYHLTYKESVSLGLITPICVIWMPVRSSVNPMNNYHTDVAREKYGMWRFSKRNKVIAEAARMFEDDDQVLISVKTLDQALHIKQYLPEFQVAYAPQDTASSNIEMYASAGLMQGMPDMTSKLLNQMRHDFAKNKLKKVIATSVWSRGVNFTDLAVLIRADGQNSEIADTQWPGRTSRLAEGKDMSIIVDFTDEYDERARRKASQRRARYEKKEWSQVNYEDLDQLIGE